MRGSSVVSTLASGDRGPGFNPRGERGKFGSEHASLCVICRDNMNTVSRPSDRDVTLSPPVHRSIQCTSA